MMGLDDERIDDPGYRPRAKWRPATGTGVAWSAREADPPDRLVQRRDPEQGQVLEAAS